MLGEEVRGALAAQLELPRQRRIEHDHRLHPHASVLGGAERDDVDARLPRHFRRGAVQRRERVGEAGAVHIGAEAVRSGGGGEFGDFGKAVDPAALGGLGQDDGAALRDVHVALGQRFDGAPQIRHRDLVGVADGVALGAAGVEFRRVAFVDIDVGERGAEHHLPRLCEQRQRERVRRGSRGDEMHGGVGGLEDPADARHHARRQLIGAVGRGMAFIRRGEGVEHLRVRRTGVVGRELHQHGSSITWFSQASSDTARSEMVAPRRDTPASWTDSSFPDTSGCQSRSGCPSCTSR